MASGKHLHIKIPIRDSMTLSKVAGTTVYLQLESFQPSGSFKIWGIKHLCKMWSERGCEHFICSSAGKAGMAAACAARKLGIPALIVVPSTTPALTIQRLKNEGAMVKVVGEVSANLGQRPRGVPGNRARSPSASSPPPLPW